jgi:hypothetical protein
MRNSSLLSKIMDLIVSHKSKYPENVQIKPITARIYEIALC